MIERAAKDSDSLLERLTRLHPKKIDLVLDRIERLLAALGHPERSLPPVIHVAGTNGKGSVIAFLRAMLEAGGYGVHVYTSPHLVDFRERIVLAAPEGGVPIPEAELARLLDQCERANAGRPITFFEITTAAALLAFARHPADVVLLEVGLGGRYDATNVIPRAAACIITPVGLDHTDFLGETLDGIAYEKAGILKPDTPAVIGLQPEPALAAITRQAARLRAPLAVAGQDFHVYEEHGRLVYSDDEGLLDLPLPRLAGRHQLANAGLALAVLRRQRALPVPSAALAQGLTAARWPGRLERLEAAMFPAIAWPRGRGEIWLDGGHNPLAARAIADFLADLQDKVARPTYLLTAMMGTKDAAGFFAPFRTLVQEAVVMPVPGQAGGRAPTDLAVAARQAGLRVHQAGGLSAALAHIAETAPVAPRVMIAGSLYLAGHILALRGKEMR